VKGSLFSIVVFAVCVVLAARDALRAPALIVPALFFAHRLTFEIARAAYLRRHSAGGSPPGRWTLRLYSTRTLAFGLALLLTPLAIIAERPSRASIAFGSIVAFIGLIATIAGLRIARDWSRRSRRADRDATFSQVGPG
jgi:hypothetical protein